MRRHALRQRCSGSHSAGVEGEEGLDIDDADTLRVELAGPDGTDFLRVGEVGLDFLEVFGADAAELEAFQ